MSILYRIYVICEDHQYFPQKIQSSLINCSFSIRFRPRNLWNSGFVTSTTFWCLFQGKVVRFCHAKSRQLWLVISILVPNTLSLLNISNISASITGIAYWFLDHLVSLLTDAPLLGTISLCKLFDKKNEMLGWRRGPQCNIVACHLNPICVLMMQSEMYRLSKAKLGQPCIKCFLCLYF